MSEHNRKRILTVDTFGVKPAVVGVLTRIDVSQMNHAEYGRRPPLGMYNLSLGEIVDRGNALIEELAKFCRVRPFDPQSCEDTLSDKQLPFLHALMNHMDDCLHLLECFFPKGDSFTKNTNVKKYRKSVDRYRSRIGLVVNKIKHEQSRIRLVVLHNKREVVPGYFVEGVLPNNAVGPHPEVHKGPFAFSYLRDIRFHLHGVYLVGQHLAKAIVGIVDGNLGPLMTPEICSSDHGLCELLKAVTDLPYVFYPDECGIEEVPWIRFSGERPDAVALEVQSRDRQSAGIRSMSQPYRSFSQTRSDGVIKRFMIPYAGRVANH